MKIIEHKRIDKGNIRAMCIKNNFYTGGTCEEYENLFDMCDGEVTPEKIYTLAFDIVEHTPRYWQMHKDEITSVMYLINKHAVTTYYDIED